MEIVFFIYEFPPYLIGGLGTYGDYITREMVKLGHDVTVFAMHSDEAPTRDVYRGIEVHRPIVEKMDLGGLLPMFIPEEIHRWSRDGQRFFGDIFLYNMLSASKLINDIVRSGKRTVDLVVSHDWLGSIGGILASRGLDKPLVYHIHSTEQGRTGGGSDTVKRLEMMAANEAARIVTVSYAMRDHLVQLGYEEKKIRVIHNGIDAEKYSPDKVTLEERRRVRRSLGIQDDELMILFVGRLNWVKGADVLVQAMSEVSRQSQKAKLVIVGVGEQQDLLRNDVLRLGLGDKVILKFEFLPEEERIRYYAASDICVFPSKYEPFGIVCAEAMALAKPVVVGAKDVSGFREQVVPSGPDQCGFHINPYDPSDIARYILILIEYGELRKKFGENARKRVLDMFTWRSVAENTLKVYSEVVA